MDTGIQVQLWNILKYFLLTLILAPIAEGAMGRITAWRNANLVNNGGKHIRLKHSMLGNIALHQEVETMHLSSRFWQLLSVLLALAIALPFEYSSDAQSQVVWSQQRSPSTTVATNGSDELMLLALGDPQQSECVDPKNLADVGEYIFLQPREDEPPILDGIVTLDEMDNFVTDPDQNWTTVTLHSRNGETDLRLYAGGQGGQQALIRSPYRRGLLIADFGTGSLCKGFLYETLVCYDMAGEFTLSQLVYSLAAIPGGAIFLRTRFEKAAKLYRFKEGLITNSIGDPSVEENLFLQRLNESGFQWLSRHEHEGQSTHLSISTLKLDEQLRFISCKTLGSVPIRPLRLQIGELLTSEQLEVNVSAKGDIRLIKAGTHLRAMLLTNVDDDSACVVDEHWGMCVNATNRTLYFLTRTRNEAAYEYKSRYTFRITQDYESHADLAVVLSQLNNDIIRNGLQNVWSVRNILSPSRLRLEGARTITRRTYTSVAVSLGTRVTGTIETWAIVLYGCLLLLFAAVLVFFRIKSLAGITVEGMYRRVVWQKDAIFGVSEVPDTPPTIGIEAVSGSGEGVLTASFYNLSKNALHWP